MLRFLQLRKQKRLLQKDIANAVGISAQAYGLYETGQREPPFDVLIRIADYFDVSVDYLLGHDFPINNPEYVQVYEALSTHSQEVAMAYMLGLLAAEGKELNDVISTKNKVAKNSSFL